MACVGIIANPSSGKDIRRLVAHGSVFSNQEKVNIVRRVLLGVDAMGVDTVLTMPDAFAICRKAQDQVKLAANLRELDIPVEFSHADTTLAARRMCELRVDCIVSLGGDGTNRVLAKAIGRTPILPLSTGTNNVFPFMMEGTLAGLAAGIVAQRVLPDAQVMTQRPRLDIEINGEVVDLALVDAVVCDERSVASRAVWDVSKVRLVVVAQRRPAQIGFMALASNVPCAEGWRDAGMVIETHPDAPAILAPIAPGLIVPIGVQRCAPLLPGEQVSLPAGASYTIALDGERERKIRAQDEVIIRLNPHGPRVIQPQIVLDLAAQHGVFQRQMQP